MFNSAYFVRWIPPVILVQISQGCYEATPDQFSFRKIPILSVFYKSGIYRKSISQSLCFVFLMTHTWDFPFYILQFHCRFKFFHTNKIKKNWCIYTGNTCKISKSISIRWWNLTEFSWLLIYSFYFYEKGCILVCNKTNIWETVISQIILNC